MNPKLKALNNNTKNPNFTSHLTKSLSNKSSPLFYKSFPKSRFLSIRSTEFIEKSNF